MHIKSNSKNCRKKYFFLTLLSVFILNKRRKKRKSSFTSFMQISIKNIVMKFHLIHDQNNEKKKKKYSLFLFEFTRF